MKRLFLAALAVALIAPAAATADIVTQWNFEGDTINPSSGTGTAQLVGGTTDTFAAGNGGGRGWNTTAYAAQGTQSGERGVAFFASTVGWENITIDFDHRASGTASRWAQLDYTLDGGTSWTTHWNNQGGLSPHDSFYSFSGIDLSSVAGANNNSQFGFRIVSIFSPLAFSQNATLDYGANEAYMRANAQASYTLGGGTGTGDYATTGTWRFDNVTINGTAAIPEPSSALVLGLISSLGLLVRRRSR